MPVTNSKCLQIGQKHTFLNPIWSKRQNMPYLSILVDNCRFNKQKLEFENKKEHKNPEKNKCNTYVVMSTLSCKISVILKVLRIRIFLKHQYVTFDFVNLRIVYFIKQYEFDLNLICNMDSDCLLFEMMLH